jgi:chemotaxis protein MotB
MARRRKPVEEENHERWLVSYADFITLLFAFFVVMYSVSSVNEGKYRVLSDSLSTAFSAVPGPIRPIEMGTGNGVFTSGTRPLDGIPAPIAINTPIFPLQPGDRDATRDDWALDKAQDEVDQLGDELGELMPDLIENEDIVVKRNRLWLEIEMKSSLLFTSASASPADSAHPVLRRLAVYLNSIPNNLQVEGYTDNKPISNGLFPSNWELSSARAAAIVRVLESYGVQPRRMLSVGYGEHQPIADNKTVSGRASNRRVVLILMARLTAGQDRDAKSLQALKQRLPQG